MRIFLIVAEAGYDGPRLAFLLADLPIAGAGADTLRSVLRRSTHLAHPARWDALAGPAVGSSSVIRGHLGSIG